MFDGISLQEAILDLFDSGVDDDHLPLIPEANRSILIQIKTPYGLTVEQTLKEFVYKETYCHPL